MSDDGGKSWGRDNLMLVRSSLQNINRSLNGRLKSLTGGTTFKLGEYVLNPADCPSLKCTYNGWTSGSTVTFYTQGNAAIRQMNIYHEFGHVLNNSTGLGNTFSGALEDLGNPSFITDDGFLNREALAEPFFITSDPNYGFVEALQHPETDPGEQWADIVANYVALNINLDRSQGRDMYDFVTNALGPYIGTP